MAVDVDELVIVQAECEILEHRFKEILNQTIAWEETYVIKKHLLLMVDELSKLEDKRNVIYKEQHSSRRISEGEQ